MTSDDIALYFLNIVKQYEILTSTSSEGLYTSHRTQVKLTSTIGLCYCMDELCVDLFSWKILLHLSYKFEFNGTSWFKMAEVFLIFTDFVCLKHLSHFSPLLAFPCSWYIWNWLEMWKSQKFLINAWKTHNICKMYRVFPLLDPPT